MAEDDVAAIKADYEGYRLGRLSSSRGNEGGNAGLTDLEDDTAAAEQERAAGGAGKSHGATAAEKPDESRRRLNTMAKALEQDVETQAAVREGGGFGVVAGFGAADDEKRGDGDAAFGSVSKSLQHLGPS